MSKTINQKFTLILVSKPHEIGRVERFLEKLREKLNLDETQYNKLLVATTEAVNNSIVHGNHRDPEKKVKLTCELNHSSLTVCVEDEGTGIEPSTLPNPLTEENLLRENGRGVFLMRSLMDSVEFKTMSKGAAVIMKMNME